MNGRQRLQISVRCSDDATITVRVRSSDSLIGPLRFILTPGQAADCT